MSVALPCRKRGHQSTAARERYEAEVVNFCDELKGIASRLGFTPGTRGWCYIAENAGYITKAEFDKFAARICDWRKAGFLPIRFCAADVSRVSSVIEMEEVHDTTPSEQAFRTFQQAKGDLNSRQQQIQHDFEHAQEIAEREFKDTTYRWEHAEEIAEERRTRAEDHFNGELSAACSAYHPHSFWDAQDNFVEMWVEKIDLFNLFLPLCRRFKIKLSNVKGWNDLNTRADTLERFKHWNAKGKRCVLLYCGDHDPAGLNISLFADDNLRELRGAVDFWFEDEARDLVVDRFGLNADFIEANALTWVDNLITSSGENLAAKTHPHHNFPYVQNYLSQFGERKVEANALVVAPAAGRQLCLEAIERYLPDAHNRHRQLLQESRDTMAAEIERLRDNEA